MRKIVCPVMFSKLFSWSNTKQYRDLSVTYSGTFLTLRISLEALERDHGFLEGNDSVNIDASDQNA